MTCSHLRRWAPLLLLASGLVFVGCDDDDDSLDEVENIADELEDRSNYEELEELLDAADLTGVLSGNGPFTVFAPNNAAVTAAADAVGSLSDAERRAVLLYHVLNGSQLSAADINEGVTVVRNGYMGPNGEVVLLVRKDGSSVFVNGSSVVEADIEATNGVIHGIDQVLLPPNVVEIAQILPNFSSLVGALTQADGDLVSALSADGPFTVFAPNDAAFMQTATGDLSSAQLANVLQYHVVSGNVLSSDLMDGMTVTTLQGGTLTVNVNGEAVTIIDENGNTRRVVNANLQGTNGVVHEIDGVLLPN